MPDADAHPTDSPMTRRHRLRWRTRLLVSIAIGFVAMLATSIGLVIAHGSSVESTAFGGSIMTNEFAVWHVNVYRRWWYTTVGAMAFRSNEAAEEYRHTLRSVTGRKPDSEHVPYWFRVAGYDPTPYPGVAGYRPDEYLYYVQDVAVGWPMRAFKVHYVLWRSFDPETRRRVPERSGSRTHGLLRVQAGVVVPTLPIWPGLIFNTLFYAAIWFALFTGLAALRTGRRLRRGLCPVCRYDLRSLPQRACPECGWGRAPAARQDADT